MSYATIDEIKTMFRELDTSVTDAAVTDDDITLFLDNSTAIIDAKIGTLYVLPITLGVNPQSFAILKQIQMFKVACVIDDILNSYGEADKKPMWCKKGSALLTALVPDIDKKTCKQCPPTMILPDAQYLGVSSQKSSIRISATSGTVFRKNEDNW